MVSPQPLPGAGHFDVVVFGASAGGLPPLRMIVRGLDRSFAAAVAVVLHRAPNLRSALSEILRRDSQLAVEDAQETTRLRPGTIVIAPTDRNLVLCPGGAVALVVGKRHFLRSAIDPVMESAAAVYGDRVVGVILSGSGTDGTDGARAVREAGGVVIVQDPATAERGSMPASVQAAGGADLCLPAEDIAGILTALVGRGRERVAAGP